jgi:ABC-type multidrug transport system fused ATPase/permease subunit
MCNRLRKPFVQVSRLASDTSILNNAITSNLSKGLQMFATVSMGMVYLFSLSARLSALMLCVVPPVTIVGRMYGRHVRGLSRKTQDALARATEVEMMIVTLPLRSNTKCKGGR